MARFKEIIKARYLRKVETKTEEILWEELRNNKLGIKFRRQHPIGVYIIDFYAPKIKLAIELDGNSHKTKDGKEYDKNRTEYLESNGVEVLRFWNSEIEQSLKNMLRVIKEKIKIQMKKFPLSSNLERGQGVRCIKIIHNILVHNSLAGGGDMV